MSVSISMLDSAYFLGRKQILDWINDLLSLELTKVEETASGAVVCQIMDVLFPGKIPMSKVNWGARLTHEFISNYKILQQAFDELRINKNIPVERLVQGRYQDNFEWLQFVKALFDHYQSSSLKSDEKYDPIARRAKGKGVKLYKPAMNDGASTVASQSVPTKSLPSSSSSSTLTITAQQSKTATSVKDISTIPSKPVPTATTKNSIPGSSTISSTLPKTVSSSTQQLQAKQAVIPAKPAAAVAATQPTKSAPIVSSVQPPNLRTSPAKASPNPTSSRPTFDHPTTNSSSSSEPTATVTLHHQRTSSAESANANKYHNQPMNNEMPLPKISRTILASSNSSDPITGLPHPPPMAGTLTQASQNHLEKISNTQNQGMATTEEVYMLTIALSSAQKQLKEAKSELEQSTKTVESLTNEIEEVRSQSLIVEREKDFYFGKLRDVEVLVQGTIENRNEPLDATTESILSRILKILYATEDDMQDISTSSSLILDDLTISDPNLIAQPILPMTARKPSYFSTNVKSRKTKPRIEERNGIYPFNQQLKTPFSSRVVLEQDPYTRGKYGSDDDKEEEDEDSGIRKFNIERGVDDEVIRNGKHLVTANEEDEEEESNDEVEIGIKDKADMFESEQEEEEEQGVENGQHEMNEEIEEEEMMDNNNEEEEEGLEENVKTHQFIEGQMLEEEYDLIDTLETDFAALKQEYGKYVENVDDANQEDEPAEEDQDA